MFPHTSHRRRSVLLCLLFFLLLPCHPDFKAQAQTNSPPVATPDGYRVHGRTEVSAPGVLANDTDPDGDPLSLSDPPGCRVTSFFGSFCIGFERDGGFTYIPPSGFTGTDASFYNVCDNKGACSRGSVTFEVFNGAPVAVEDAYVVHGAIGRAAPGYLANDYDPDGDPFFVSGLTGCNSTAHGALCRGADGSFSYSAARGFVGTDAFAYRVCDTLGACAEATVTLFVVNDPPAAVADTYTVHRFLEQAAPGFLANDADPEGDSFSFNGTPGCGSLRLGWFCRFADGSFAYRPSYGNTGVDTFPYAVCDEFGACSSAVITFNVVNAPPSAGADVYNVRGEILVDAPGVLANDRDPDGDPISVTDPPGTGIPLQHGVLSRNQQGAIFYRPLAGFEGTDTYVYNVCDDLGACSKGTVTFVVSNGGGDGAENAGLPPCGSSVGLPVNVTNGNMYLQQTDYRLPGVGVPLDLTRTYNSVSRRVGLFGRGWSTAFDESVESPGPSQLRLNLPDGRAVYFDEESEGVFAPRASSGLYGRLSRNSDGGFTLSLAGGGLQQFDGAGRLLRLEDRYGNTTTLSYDASGRLTSIADPFGRSLTLTTTADGLVASVSDPAGAVADYAYGDGQELLSVTYADGSMYRFGYLEEPRLLLSSVTDALGNVVESHAYDARGRAVTSERHGGVNRLTLEYVGDAETRVTDALGHVTEYFFENRGGRTAVTRVEGACGCGGSQVRSWAYDEHLNVTSETDALGHTTEYRYDAQGNRLTRRDAAGEGSFTYNQFGQPLTITGPSGATVTNTYDAQGRLLSTRDPLGRVTTFSYDSRSLLLAATDARSNTTRFDYDASGDLLKITDAAGGVTAFAYDARGRVTKRTDALGGVTEFLYDAAGRPAKVIRPDGSSVGFTYDLAGRRTGLTDARGHRATYAYDQAYRLTSVTDAAGNTTSYDYDAMSNLRAVTDPLGQALNFEYDGFDRLSKIIYPEATPGAGRLEAATEYDAGGRVVRRTDAAGRATLYTYDAANRLVAITDPLLQETRYEYDARSLLTAVVDAAGQRYEFAYDGAGHLTGQRRGASAMSFAYDEAGNLLRRTDYNGSDTAYAYDALNRLTEVRYADGGAARYAYDRLSRLVSAANQTGTVTFAYDVAGRVSGMTDVSGLALSYTYDRNGNRTSLRVGGALYSTYEYDELDRLTRLTDAAGRPVSYGHDALGRLTSRGLPNGVKTAYRYDALNRLTRLTDSSGAAALTDTTYRYDPFGNITLAAELSGTNTYSYDALDRLTRAAHTRGQPAESYTYDAVGNRTASHLSPTYSYEPFNRLTGTSAASYVYDANGNLTSKTASGATTAFVWDAENRLAEVRLPGGGVVTHLYDALGRRVSTTAPASRGRAVVTTAYAYDGADVLRDTAGDGRKVETVDYLRGPVADDLLRQTTTRTHGKPESFYFLTDHLGSPRALTDERGRVAEQLSYDGFGGGPGSALTRYGFTGRERDPQTGLYYYRSRWYDPQLGRFLSEDPLGLAAGANQYAYVSNNPVNKTDPLGLYEIDVHYYLTYFLALRTGCFNDWEAHDIAHEDEMTDDNPSTMPGPGTTAQQRMQNRVYHALHPGAAEGVGSPLLWQGALNEADGHHQWFGRYLHYLQDTFSHKGYASDKWGHSPLNLIFGNLVWGDHDTDKTAYNGAKARRMAGLTWVSLLEYAKVKKCGCNPRWDNSWWDQINDFINVGTDSPRLSAIDATQRTWANPALGDVDALERKRRILGLPDRYSGQW